MCVCDFVSAICRGPHAVYSMLVRSSQCALHTIYIAFSNIDDHFPILKYMYIFIFVI